MKRYSFTQSDEGPELWVWLTWACILFLTIAVGFYSMGKVTESYYHKSIMRGMYYELAHACDEKIEIDTSGIAEYDSTGKRIN